MRYVRRHSRKSSEFHVGFTTVRADETFSALLRSSLRVGVILLFLSGVAQAVPITIDFSGTGGLLGTQLVTPEGVVVDGFSFSGGAWSAAKLFQRDETNDHGLGICNPDEESVPCMAPGGGDVNELDNDGRPELIRLTLPADSRWLRVWVSSLDGNDDNGTMERGELFSDADGDPAALDKVLWQFEGGGGNPVEPSFPIAAVDQLAQYLFFRPLDWKNGTNFNNDYLVWKVRIDGRVPEPGTLGLLTAGLLGLGLAWKRKKTGPGNR